MIEKAASSIAADQTVKRDVTSSATAQVVTDISSNVQRGAMAQVINNVQADVKKDAIDRIINAVSTADVIRAAAQQTSYAIAGNSTDKSNVISQAAGKIILDQNYRGK